MPQSKSAAPKSQGPAIRDAIIVGAGFAGMYQLHLLRDRLGLDVVVLETGKDVGGTWYWNRYPGARCDSESQGYCYSFSDELVRDWEWTQRYPDHAEIRRYLSFVADRLDLRRDIRFSTTVTSATYDETQNLWQVKTAAGETLAARFLITAVGCLSTTNMPDIPGRDSYKGRLLHTGQWPHEDVDFSGLRVGLIGTGSTGIQATPVIAEKAKHLYVFQRTPNYSVPARNAPLTPEFKKHVKENFDDIRAVMRSTTNGHPFRIEDRSVFDVSDEERERLYERQWAQGGLQFRAAFRDILLDKKANDTAAEFLKRKIRETVRDPRTAELLSNIDHPYSAKRPPIDTGYFEAFNRENVTLVDIRSAPIEAITPTGLRTKAATYDLDMIVFATGYDAMTGPLARLNLTGRNGTRLADVWKEGPKTYLGLQIAGFPNLFTVTGPMSPSVLTNMPQAIEQHVEWITDCIARMRKTGASTIEPTAEAIDDWVRENERAANVTLLPTVPHSWYLGANIPGKPRIFMPYAGGLAHYRKICDDIAAAGYKGFAIR